MTLKITKKILLASLVFLSLTLPIFAFSVASAEPPGVDDNRAVGGQGNNQGINLGSEGGHQCGNLPNNDDNWKTKINFGCLGRSGPSGLGPIQDLLFALIRFLSIGVGVIIAASIIAAGIQYTTAEGNAEATQKAKRRIQNATIGLVIFIFAWSALQYLIPGGLFKPGIWMSAEFIRGLL